MSEYMSDKNNARIYVRMYAIVSIIPGPQQVFPLCQTLPPIDHGKNRLGVGDGQVPVSIGEQQWCVVGAVKHLAPVSKKAVSVVGHVLPEHTVYCIAWLPTGGPTTWLFLW